MTETRHQRSMRLILENSTYGGKQAETKCILREVEILKYRLKTMDLTSSVIAVYESRVTKLESNSRFNEHMSNELTYFITDPIHKVD